MRGLITILIAGLLVASAHAQQVELRIEARTLQEGESVELTLTCTNTGDPDTPQFETPPGLELRLLNLTPARSSMVSLINGRRSETTTHTFSLRLTGLKAGSYTLNPIVVPAGGSTFQTDPISITVTKPSNELLKDGDKLVFARISVQPTSLYVTQSAEATLTLAIRKFERDGQPVELGNMLSLVDAGGSELSVFGTRFNSSEVTLADSNGQRHTYLVYRQTKEVRVEQVGTMRIGPVFFKQDPGLPSIGFYVRTARDTNTMATAIRAAVRELDANVPVFELMSMQAQLEQSVSSQRTMAFLSNAFGFLATLLAAIGLYGVISHSVTSRTGEIGIRIALGAARSDVVRMVLREVILLSAVGIIAGLVLAVWLGRYVETQLFEMKARDPQVMSAAAAILTLTAFLAGWFPARRAARTDPMTALRHQ